MGQPGFFDLNRRYESLTEKNDPLVAIAAMVPFDRPKLHTALIKGELRRSEAERRNSAGRKPWDEVVIFIHRRAYRNRKLSEAQRAANTTRSKVRARVEHVFGDQKNGMGTGIVRTIGIIRARCKIEMTNLVYNMPRFVCLERMTAAAG